MCNKNIQIEAEKALSFLNDHPAINMAGWDFLQGNASWSFWQLCKNGEMKEVYIKPESVRVDVDKKHPKFNELFPKFRDNDDTDAEVAESDYSMWVPYRDVYGCEWEFDRMEYWMELVFYKYNRKRHMEYTNLPAWKSIILKLIAPLQAGTLKFEREFPTHRYYDAYHGADVKGSSLEDCFVKMAEIVRKNYGDYKRSDFVTDDEKKNHDENSMFIRTPASSGGCYLNHNPAYIDVNDHTINERWWKWFRGSLYYKEHWNGE